MHDITKVSIYRGALNFASGAELLLTDRNKTPIDAFGVLVSHSLELGLKSFLIHSGKTEKYIIKKIGHNLVKSWEVCISFGLEIDDPPPFWCQVLNSAHDFPYLFRYARENTGVVVPAVDTLMTDLNAVLQLIGKEIGLDENGNAV